MISIKFLSIIFELVYVLNVKCQDRPCSTELRNYVYNVQWRFTILYTNITEDMGLFNPSKAKTQLNETGEMLTNNVRNYLGYCVTGATILGNERVAELLKNGSTVVFDGALPLKNLTYSPDTLAIVRTTAARRIYVYENTTECDFLKDVLAFNNAHLGFLNNPNQTDLNGVIIQADVQTTSLGYLSNRHITH